jgi:hypothetical protein
MEIRLMYDIVSVGFGSLDKFVNKITKIKIDGWLGLVLPSISESV